MSTEQFLYEIAKKYKDWDITVMYEQGDEEQLKRLRKFVRCVKWEKPQIVECEKYFANFNLGQFPYVKAKEYYFCVHANFEEIGYKPDISKLTNDVRFLGVSKFAQREFIKFTGKDCGMCYNPLTIEPKEKIVHLVSACRLNDVVKGGARTQKLVEALDKYCLLNNRHYIWHIFTNENTSPIKSQNVCLMKPRIDVRPYIADADVGLQLSNDMETYCYSLAEFGCYGLNIVTTPLSVLPEHNLPDYCHKVLDWNCENVDEVAKWIMETEKKPYKYDPPKDEWEKLLAKGESTYQKELKMKFKIKALKWEDTLTDNDVARPRQVGEIWVVNKERLDTLQNCEQLKVEVLEQLEEATMPQKKKVVRKKVLK